MKTGLKRVLAILLAVVLTVLCVIPGLAETLKTGSSGKKVKAMQEALTVLGYYDGKVDSNFSKVFAESVKAFQADFGLKVTGTIDDDLYELLEAEAADYTEPEETAQPQTKENDKIVVEKDGSYSDKEHVAAYLRKYGKLPGNYVTKAYAESKGWVSYKGNLWKVLPGCSIGGDRFGNYEGQLPEKNGRKYYECDIDFDGGTRNAKRIIFSNDGLIFYTEDHYTTFEELTE